eukprot:7084314-Heterocapsa_arctica.AAC.1
MVRIEAQRLPSAAGSELCSGVIGIALPRPTRAGRVARGAGAPGASRAWAALNPTGLSLTWAKGLRIQTYIHTYIHKLKPS